LSKRELTAHVNMSEGRIEKALLLMSLESPAPVIRQGNKWVLGVAELSEAFWQRAETITALRQTEQQQMQQYVGLKKGHMEFLIDALDGAPVAFHSPTIPALPTTVDARLVQEAVTFLRRSNLPLYPRKQWPTGGLPQMNVKGNIPEHFRVQPGKVLCLWGDAGWGDLVRRGKYHDRHFADGL